MNKSVEILRNRIRCNPPCEICKENEAAAAEIERLEAALVEKDAMFARLKTEPACVRVNMLRGELAMLPELEQVREYQGLVEAQQAKIAGLEAERDRLRAALNRISEHSSDAFAKDVARAALAGKDAQ